MVNRIFLSIDKDVVDGIHFKNELFIVNDTILIYCVLILRNDTHKTLLMLFFKDLRFLLGFWLRTKLGVCFYKFDGSIL